MGVDYSGHHGIGIQVKPIDFEDENLNIEIAELEAMCEFLDTHLNLDLYNWFEVGEGSYTGEQDDVFIILKEPFIDGYNSLEVNKLEMIKHINEIGLETIGEFGSVGGVQVW